eukprot:3253933-Rhodomonas_salina.2
MARAPTAQELGVLTRDPSRYALTAVLLHLQRCERDLSSICLHRQETQKMRQTVRANRQSLRHVTDKGPVALQDTQRHDLGPCRSWQDFFDRQPNCVEWDHFCSTGGEAEIHGQ